MNKEVLRHQLVEGNLKVIIWILSFFLVIFVIAFVISLAVLIQHENAHRKFEFEMCKIVHSLSNEDDTIYYFDCSRILREGVLKFKISFSDPLRGTLQDTEVNK